MMILASINDQILFILTVTIFNLNIRYISIPKNNFWHKPNLLLKANRPYNQTLCSSF